MKAITSNQRIQVPAPSLWAAITADHHLEACHPYIQRHTQNERTNGISDTITYLNGVTFTRESTAWVKGVGYDLKVGKARGRKNEVSWRIVAVDESSCQLSISVIPRAVEKYPKVLRRLALALFVRRQVRLYLNAVTGGIKMWMETGQPIDQLSFRQHPWFCPSS